MSNISKHIHKKDGEREKKKNESDNRKDKVQDLTLVLQLHKVEIFPMTTITTTTKGKYIFPKTNTTSTVINANMNSATDMLPSCSLATV